MTNFTALISREKSTFLYQLQSGVCDRALGLMSERLSVPQEVIEDAKKSASY